LARSASPCPIARRSPSKPVSKSLPAEFREEKKAVAPAAVIELAAGDARLARTVYQAALRDRRRRRHGKIHRGGACVLPGENLTVDQAELPSRSVHAPFPRPFPTLCSGSLFLALDDDQRYVQVRR